MTEYRAFFALLRKAGIPAEERDAMIREYTDGRTTSLREMHHLEYRAMVADLTASIQSQAERDELRRRRSMVLCWMQKIGVDTTDWKRVDDVCRDPRIGGKRFAALTFDELEDVRIRLIAVWRKRNERQNEERKKRALREN
jgi:hypothetical protein